MATVKMPKPWPLRSGGKIPARSAAVAETRSTKPRPWVSRTRARGQGSRARGWQSRARATMPRPQRAAFPALRAVSLAASTGRRIKAPVDRISAYNYVLRLEDQLAQAVARLAKEACEC